MFPHWAVVVVKWSAWLPSALTIQVCIPLKPKSFFCKISLWKEQKTKRGWGQPAFKKMIRNLFLICGKSGSQHSPYIIAYTCLTLLLNLTDVFRKRLFWVKFHTGSKSLSSYQGLREIKNCLIMKNLLL